MAMTDKVSSPTVGMSMVVLCGLYRLDDDRATFRNLSTTAWRRFDG